MPKYKLLDNFNCKLSILVYNILDSLNYVFLKILWQINNEKNNEFGLKILCLIVTIILLCYYVSMLLCSVFKFFLLILVFNLSNSSNYKFSKIFWSTNNKKVNKLRLSSLFSNFLFSLLLGLLLLFGLLSNIFLLLGL